MTVSRDTNNTPEGALGRRLQRLESQIRLLMRDRASRQHLGVSEGDFIVAGGGSVEVEDGGGVHVTEGGDITVQGGKFAVLDATGKIVAEMEAEGITLSGDNGVVMKGETGFRWVGETGQEGAVLGADSNNRVYFRVTDTSGNPRTFFGALYTDDTLETFADYGLSIEDSNGEVVSSIDPTLFFVGIPKVVLSEGIHPDNQVTLWAEDGKNDYLYLYDANGDPTLVAASTTLAWSKNGAATWRLDRDGKNTIIQGGSTDTDDGLWQRINIMGGSGTREVRIQSWDGTAYGPMRASAFNIATSSATTKHMLADPEPDALSRVRNTPIRRWRHNAKIHDPKTGEDTGQQYPEQLGPVVEEATPEIVAPSPEDGDDGIDLAASLWTLWQAVQEQAEMIDRLQDRIAALEAAR